MKKKLILEPYKVKVTVEQLGLRIDDRFAGSGLSNVCRNLKQIAKETENTISWIGRPHYVLKSISGLAICALVVTLAVILFSLKGAKELTVIEFISTTEASTNLLIFLAIAIYFLWSIEMKIKRNRAVTAINKLRNLAHIIDMHQLTKDPDRISSTAKPTAHSPKRELSSYELSRYLDYCSEMLSLISKLGYLYITQFQDPVATNSVNELETLTTGLSRKIWQKIMIVKSMQTADEMENSKLKSPNS